jgi:hypothetical protein
MSNQASFRAVGRCQGEEGASCMVNSFFQYASREEPQGTLSTSYVHSTGGENCIGDEKFVSPDRSELGIHGDF